MAVTDYQQRIYTLLVQIPPGRVSTYKALAEASSSSARAVGGAMRRNPWAPEVPCHRLIAATGFIGGFMGDWEKAPSGQNQNKKLELLREEGVLFDEKGMLVDKTKLWDRFDLGDSKETLEGCVQRHKKRIASQLDRPE